MTRPNIVFILADDLGWADLSVYGQTDYQTPHLDDLAAEGVRFTQAYANSAVCSATRFALLTGRYPYRLRGGLEEPIARTGAHHGLPPEHPTLPSLLRSLGYRTALIGKWHLGHPPTFGPLKSGYDRFFGNLSGVVDYFTHKPGVGEHVPRDLWEGEQAVERQGYYTQILADEAAAHIRAQRPGEPFFLSLHFTAPHWPWVGPEDEHVSRTLTDLFHYDGGHLEVYIDTAARWVRHHQAHGLGGKGLGGGGGGQRGGQAGTKARAHTRKKRPAAAALEFMGVRHLWLRGAGTKPASLGIRAGGAKEDFRGSSCEMQRKAPSPRLRGEGSGEGPSAPGSHPHPTLSRSAGEGAAAYSTCRCRSGNTLPTLAST
jgi:hypothetical protein